MSERYEDCPRSLAEVLTARRGWFDLRDPDSPIVWEDEVSPEERAALEAERVARWSASRPPV